MQIEFELKFKNWTSKIRCSFNIPKFNDTTHAVLSACDVSLAGSMLLKPLVLPAERSVVSDADRPPPGTADDSDNGLDMKFDDKPLANVMPWTTQPTNSYINN